MNHQNCLIKKNPFGLHQYDNLKKALNDIYEKSLASLSYKKKSTNLLKKLLEKRKEEILKK